MLRILLYALLAWFLYKLIFDFIVPVYKTTRQVKKAFRDMHNRVHEAQANQNGYTQPPPSQKSSPPQSSNGDYIDFEEIK